MYLSFLTLSNGKIMVVSHTNTGPLWLTGCTPECQGSLNLIKSTQVLESPFWLTHGIWWVNALPATKRWFFDSKNLLVYAIKFIILVFFPCRCSKFHANNTKNATHLGHQQCFSLFLLTNGYKTHLFLIIYWPRLVCQNLNFMWHSPTSLTYPVSLYDKIKKKNMNIFSHFRQNTRL